jgi:hypothetical protein
MTRPSDNSSARIEPGTVELALPVFIKGGQAPGVGWGTPVGSGDVLGSGWCMCVDAMAGFVRRYDIWFREP